MQNVKDLSIRELEQLVEELQEPAYRVNQLIQWLYQKGAGSFDQMTDLPATFREKLKKNYFVSWPKIAQKQVSKDKTVKYLFELSDGEKVESVLIPHQNRYTICLSTQVGCKLGCKFCASGVAGFARNLTPGEILDELLMAQADQKNRRITNIVFMGMGEPMDNYSNLLKAIRWINHSKGINIGARKITVSTSGIIPGIRKLVDEGLQVELSVSLHAADSKTRNRIMPINRKYSIEELMATCRGYIKKTNRQITFEYTLIAGLNDRKKDAEQLAQLLRRMKCQVNLIPLNPIKEFPYKQPLVASVKEFRKRLQSAGIAATVRKSMGRDIDGACGQLRLRDRIQAAKGRSR